MDGGLDRVQQHSSFNEDFELFWDGLKAVGDRSTKSGFEINPSAQDIESLLPLPQGHEIHAIKIYDPENDKDYKNLMWVSNSLIPAHVEEILNSSGKKYHLKASHGRSFTPDKRGKGMFGKERWDEVVTWCNTRAGLRVKPPAFISRILGL